MNKKLLWVFFGASLMSFLVAQPASEEGFYSFGLKYSEAVNAFAAKDYARAAKVARFLMKNHKNRPEGYKIFADVHQKDGLCQQAMGYYQKALALRSQFLLQQERMNLYSDMAGCFVRMNAWDKAIKTLNRIVEAVDVHTIDHFRKKRGEAYFSLALIHQLRGEKTASRLYFLKAAQDGFRKKISYLLVLYYYVKNSQEDIVENNMIYHRKKVKSEDRKAAFEHFYRFFVREPADEDYEKIIRRVDYKKVLNAVVLFRSALFHQAENKKNATKDKENAGRAVSKNAEGAGKSADKITDKNADKNPDEKLEKSGEDVGEKSGEKSTNPDADDTKKEDEENLFFRRLF